jgi:hypothetical protein
MLITKNCIINGMPEEVYHNDPTPLLDGFKDCTSLSSSTLCDLVEYTEIEARMGINRLNPPRQRETTDASDLGNIAHDYVLLGGEDKFEVAPVDAWRTNDAKAMKKDILSRGKIPLNLSTQSILQDVKKMETRLHEQVAEHKDYPEIMLKGKGSAEQSGFAHDGEIWNRARFDRLETQPKYENLIVDYKTTGIDFGNWEKNELWKTKFYQEHHYKRVLNMIRNPDSAPARFIYLVQQVKEPYLIRIYEIDKSYEDEIAERYMRGRARFINCIKTGVWRGETKHTVHSCPPSWTLTQWEIDNAIAKEEAQREKAQSAANKPDADPISLRAAG